MANEIPKLKQPGPARERAGASGFSAVLRGALLGARSAGTVRACTIVAGDHARAVTVAADTAQDVGCPAYVLSAAGSRRWDAAVGGWRPLPGETSPDPAAMLRQAIGVPGGGLVVLEDVLPALRDEGGDPRARALLTTALEGPSAAGLLLAFLAPAGAGAQLPGLLAEQIPTVEIPLPRRPELELLARRELLAAAHRLGAPLPGPVVLREHAAALAGTLAALTEAAAQKRLGDVLEVTGFDLEATRAELERRRAETLARELQMTLLEPAGDEVAIGLEHLLEHLAIDRERAHRHGRERARGVLLVGPPGTGKTLMARTIGRALGMPAIDFRVSSLLGSLVGESERRFQHAFATLAALAPSVVFIDELEKVFGETNERDGNTMMRCTSAFLSWLNDNPNPNYVVGTANSIDRMGEIGWTMTRRGRFDGVFFVDNPTLRSRRAMLERWLSGLVPEPARVAAALAGETPRFSGADLRSVVDRARARAAYLGVPLSLEELRAQIVRNVARVEATYAQFEGLRAWARAHCEPAGIGE